MTEELSELNTYTSRSKDNIEVPSSSVIAVDTFTITKGVWLLCGYMQWNGSFNLQYNFQIGSNVVRANGTNGGGINNVVMLNVTSDTQTIDVRIYQPSGSTQFCYYRMYMVKLK